MTNSVCFRNVSKQYRLGLSRVSLPSIVSQALRGHLTPSARRPAREQLMCAVKDVSFELGRGESLALVGQNGAGKTTILKLLANITRPTTGSIQVSGQLSALIELGAGFHPDLTGRENVYLNGTILGLKRKEIDSRFDEIVAFSEIEEFIDTPVKRYSSGMAVRLGFAVAACIEPDVLLVDEVLAVGDASFRLKCMQRIESLLRNGTSIIFVSHNFYLVQAVCSSALYLDRGQVKDRGDTRCVIKTYERDLHEQRARRLDMGRPTQVEDQPTADIEIDSVEIAASGSEKAGLRSNEPVKILIRYVAYQPAPAVHVAVHITRSDGLTCCMMRTSLDGVRLSFERGAGIVSVMLKRLQLISGAYFAEAHFLNATDSMVIGSAASDWFSVTGSGLSYEERSGVFEPDTSWAHHQISPEPALPAGTGF